MLKQLVEDIKNEVVRKSYLDKVGLVGQKDIEISLLGYPMITPENIITFLERNFGKIYKEVMYVRWNRQTLKNRISKAVMEEFEEWLGDSIGFYARISGDSNDAFIALIETRIESYSKFIPEHCLDRVIAAKDTGFFDYLTVGVPDCDERLHQSDPVVFGRRNNSPNRFYICQWDNDVTLDDLL